jgi:uncharacterized protein YkwD
MSPRSPRLVLGCTVALLLVGAVTSGAADAHRRRAPRAAVSQSCPYADVSVGSAPLSAMRTAVLCLIDQQRMARGLPGLRPSPRLNRVAQRQTQTMVATGYFGHGANFTLRFSAVGYHWRTAGEDIASGYTTPREVVAAWMASTEHCRNILSPGFRDAGTGVAAAAVGAGVSPGTWTEDFGLRMSQSPPSGNRGPESGCPY